MIDIDNLYQSTSDTKMGTFEAENKRITALLLICSIYRALRTMYGWVGSTTTVQTCVVLRYGFVNFFICFGA